MQSTGISLLLDLYDCLSPYLNNADALQQLFAEALHTAGFQVVERLAHRFAEHGQGTTMIFILQQSHAALHTWPESGYISVDVYSCGRSMEVRAALEALCIQLSQKLSAGRTAAQWVERNA
jgi:S-adenosylmethionine decarboxylase